MKSTPRRNSAILWTVNLASIGASVFSYVYLSYFVYVKSGSVLLAEAVLVAPMVIPALLCLMVNRVAGGNAPRRVLLLANGGGIVLSLVVYAGVESWPSLPCSAPCSSASRMPFNASRARWPSSGTSAPPM